MLDIKLVGPISFTNEYKDLTYAINDKMAAIVAILMLSNAKAVSRDRLIEYLWPQSSEKAAKYNLRYNLWALKKVFTDDGKTDDDLIVVNKDMCKINSAYEYSCDLVDIESVKYNHALGVGDLESAYSLFRGDFLEGCYYNGCREFNEIIIQQRNYLEQTKLNIINEMAIDYCDSENNDKTIWALGESIKIDPYNEQIAILLIDALLKANNRNAALKVHRDIINRLACELNVEPCEELKNKFNQIRYSPSNGIKDEDSIRIVITDYCVKSTDGFALSMVIDYLIENGSINIQDYLTENQANELSFFNSSLSKGANQVTLNKAVKSIMLLLKNISGYFTLIIEIADIETVDIVSREVLNYLSDSHYITILTRE